MITAGTDLYLRKDSGWWCLTVPFDLADLVAEEYERPGYQVSQEAPAAA